MKTKLLNLALILTSLIGYLEWGTNNSSFLFQAEFEVLQTLIRNPIAAAHPFTLIPLLGQILLLVTLFQKKASKWLTLISILCLGFLFGFMFVVGILAMSANIILSTLPFIITAVLAIRAIRQKHKTIQVHQ